MKKNDGIQKIVLFGECQRDIRELVVRPVIVFKFHIDFKLPAKLFVNFIKQRKGGRVLKASPK